MRQNILLSIIFLLLFPILFLFGASVVYAESLEEAIIENDYSLSESFENIENNDFYTYDPERSTIAISFWTKTGNIVSIFDVGGLGDLKEGIFGHRTTEPAAQTSSNPAPLSSSGMLNLGTLIGAKIMAATLGIPAIGHPWFFLMTLSFGTILLSGWFLRFSTGVSPPVSDLWAGGPRTESNNLNH